MAAETETPKYALGIPGVNLEEVQRNVPENEPPPLAINEKLHTIGKSVPRLDGRAKVTGAARYTADINLPGMLYGKLVSSTETAAKIKSIDTSEAEKIPGVKAVYLIERNMAGAGANASADDRFPLVRYCGQPIAAVAATTPEIARQAAKAIKVEYDPRPWVTDIEEARKDDAPQVISAGSAPPARGNVQQRGNVRGPQRGGGASQEAIDKALAESDAVVEAEYHTQVQTHSVLETHGYVADFKPDQLTIYASTQSTQSVRDEMASYFNLQRNKVRVITEFMGGGFGSKLSAGIWASIAGRLSQKAGAPVKLMCDRKEEQQSAGNRPSSNQKIRLGAKKDGSLTAFHLVNYGTAGAATGAGVGGATGMYPIPLALTESSDVMTNAGPQAAFRAPGFPQGIFAFEQAVDELAEKLNIDPLEFREKIDVAPPAGSRGTTAWQVRKEERRVGAEKIGWKNRKAPNSDTGPIKRGVGMAQGTWNRNSNGSGTCEVRINRDGSVEALSAVQDIGSGIRTVMAMVVAEELGIQPADVQVRVGDTNFPPGVSSGGSVTTNSMTPPTRKAAYQAKQELLKQVAPVFGVQPSDLAMNDGKIFVQADPTKSLTLRQAATKMQGEHISAQASRGNTDYATGPGMGGVQFAQVAVDTETGQIKVERIVAAQDCGRPMNPLTLRNQINGGVIQGLSYALLEDRILDRQTGYMVNPNFEQYKIAGASEMPQIDVIVVEQYCARSSTDAAGIGEPATVPTSSAIANAVYNAIGVRIRTIPMTPKVVLEALAARKSNA
ncbi:MAG TPA: xanthine dehydrogenase family protein molybdopterin-binding subunit [Tepidisphaeraceae bacterium]|nr:xanthine dehydrogenase family protein molybdopterin-binding subunit [Tepidisphaeraceae bacterium]